MQTFESYDYLKVPVDENFLSQYLDGYGCFGWKPDDNVPPEKTGGKVQLHFKRSRNIPGKTELIRLQQHYEACMAEIATLESANQGQWQDRWHRPAGSCGRAAAGRGHVPEHGV